MLLGQNVNAYNDGKNRLSNLIMEIEKIEDIKRIRYTTSHPKDMTEDLIDVYKNSQKLMPLVHLPVQSGSDKILELMNRKHTIKDYLHIFEKLKNINRRGNCYLNYEYEDKNKTQKSKKQNIKHFFKIFYVSKSFK